MGSDDCRGMWLIREITPPFTRIREITHCGERKGIVNSILLTHSINKDINIRFKERMKALKHRKGQNQSSATFLDLHAEQWKKMLFIVIIEKAKTT